MTTEQKYMNLLFDIEMLKQHIYFGHSAHHNTLMDKEKCLQCQNEHLLQAFITKHTKPVEK